MKIGLKVLASASAGLLLLGGLTAHAVGVGQQAIAQATAQGDQIGEHKLP